MVGTERVKRLLVVYLAGLALLVATMVSAVYGVDAREAQPGDAGVLGQPRSEVEARFGPPTEQVEMSGRPIYDETYAYEAEDATIYISYRDANGVQVAAYIELDWRGDGVDKTRAQEAVASLLPPDAKRTELYTAPPTLGGPLAIDSRRYESASLRENPVLAPEVLVNQQQRWPDDEAAAVMVESTSLTIRERTQLTG